MDPISDMLIRIQNAQRAGHQAVQIPYSKIKHEIAKALERGGLVGRVERKGKRIKKFLEVELLGGREHPGFSGVRLISTPGRRVYQSYKDVRPASRGGSVIMTTSKGILTGQEARRQRVGGQVIAEVW